MAGLVPVASRRPDRRRGSGLAALVIGTAPRIAPNAVREEKGSRFCDCGRALVGRSHSRCSCMGKDHVKSPVGLTEPPSLLVPSHRRCLIARRFGRALTTGSASRSPSPLRGSYLVDLTPDVPTRTAVATSVVLLFFVANMYRAHSHLCWRRCSPRYLCSQFCS